MCETFHVNRYLFIDAKHEGARVLQSPLNIWNLEVGCERDACRLRVRGDLHFHRVLLTVQVEDPVNGEIALSRLIEVAFDVRRAKGDGLVLGAVQNILVHLLIPRRAPALATCCVDLDEAGCVACERIVMNQSFLEAKGAMYGVEYVLERPVNGCGGGIKCYVERVRGLGKRSDGEDQ